MLRAVKDAHELARLAAAGAAADATFERDPRPYGSPAAGRPTSPPTWPGCCASTGTSRSTSPWSAPGPTAPTRTTRPASGSSRTATRWCSTSAGSSTGTAPTPPAPSTWASRTDEVRDGARDRRAGPAGRLRGGPPRGACEEIDRVAREVITEAPATGSTSSTAPATASASPRTSRRTWWRASGSRCARHVLLDRARHLSARPVRRADRGHRDGHRGRRAAAQQHRPRACASCACRSPVTR